VVAVIIDQVISWVWDWWSDPKGKMSEQLRQKLDEMQAAVMNGESQHPGLRESLQQLAKNRSKIRRQAMVIVLSKIQS
jgi:hypothetical protein